MKRVLIAGAGSYIGERHAAWLNRAPECFSVDTADLRAQGWQQADWTGWDAVVLVAGIAHRKAQPGDEASGLRVTVLFPNAGEWPQLFRFSVSAKRASGS